RKNRIRYPERRQVHRGISRRPARARVLHAAVERLLLVRITVALMPSCVIGRRRAAACAGERGRALRQASELTARCGRTGRLTSGQGWPWIPTTPINTREETCSIIR